MKFLKKVSPVDLSVTIFFNFGLLLLGVVLAVLPQESFGQQLDEYGIEEVSFDFDKLYLPIHISKDESFEIELLYAEDGKIYVNTEALFKSVKIAIEVSGNGDTLFGFIEQESKKYQVFYPQKIIQVGQKNIDTKDQMVKNLGFIYMESGLLKEAFGIEVIFNLRNLSALLKSSFEFPLIKQISLEQKHNKKIKKLIEIEYDSTLKKQSHFFKFGMVDWSASWSYSDQNPIHSYLSATIGTELLFGQFTTRISSIDVQKPENNNIRYQWKWVNNESKILRQAKLGKLMIPSVRNASSNILGVNLKNTPTYVRKAKGYHYISETTEPNWNVELYLNNQLIDFQTADATGHFIFKIPIVYGYTQITLKYYGEHGETRIEERVLNLPYTFMPKNEFDYQISFGKKQGKADSYLGKAEASFGLSSHLTISGGAEYLYKNNRIEKVPFSKFAYQPFPRLNLSGEHYFSYKTSGLLSYYLSKSAELRLSYNKFNKSYLSDFEREKQEERGVKLTFPVRLKKVKGFLRFDFKQFVYENSTRESLFLIYSLGYRSFSFNTSSILNWSNWESTAMETELSMSYRFKRFSIRPSVKYNVTSRTFVMAKCGVEKRYNKGTLGLGYEYNFAQQRVGYSIKLRLNLGACRNVISGTRRGKSINASHQVSGSIVFDQFSTKPMKESNSSLGKGGVRIRYFLDVNNNQVYDKGEKKVPIRKVRVSRGKMLYDEKDTVLRVYDLSAFNYTILNFQELELESISWRYSKKNYRVYIDPNQFKKVDVPITVVGEIRGNVYLQGGKKTRNASKIALNVYKIGTDKRVAEIYTESDGYFEFIGLEPGKYVLRPNEEQLKRLRLISTQKELFFTIKESEEGDSIELPDLVLKKN